MIAPKEEASPAQSSALSYCGRSESQTERRKEQNRVAQRRWRQRNNERINDLDTELRREKERSAALEMEISKLQGELRTANQLVDMCFSNPST